jgi:hypothetical protein
MQQTETIILCRKCGAEGTARCSLPGCPLPQIDLTPGLIEEAALKQHAYAEKRKVYTGVCLVEFALQQAAWKAAHPEELNDQISDD